MDIRQLIDGNDTFNITSSLPTASSNARIYTVFEKLILLLYFFTVMVVSVFGNMFVVILIIKYRQLHTITNFFIINVAIADILVGALVMPFTIFAVITSVHNLTDYRWCIAEWFLSAFLPSASSLSLCCVSLDRYFAITRPYFYHEIVTKKRAIIGEILSWTIAGLCASIQFTWCPDRQLFCNKLAYGTGKLLDNIYMTAALCIVCYFPIILFIYIYGTIFSIAASHAKKIRRDSCAGSVGSRKPIKRRGIREQHESKAAAATAIIVGAFVFCWLPFTIVMLINRWFGKTSLVINAVTAMIVMGNSAVNPILYIVFKRDIKCVVKKLLCCCQQATPEPPRTSSVSITHVKLGPTNSSLTENNSYAPEVESYRF